MNSNKITEIERETLRKFHKDKPDEVFDEQFHSGQIYIKRPKWSLDSLADIKGYHGVNTERELIDLIVKKMLNGT